MIKRTIDISDGPTFLFVADDQLVLSRDRVEIARIPCEDVGVLLVDRYESIKPSPEANPQPCSMQALRTVRVYQTQP